MEDDVQMVCGGVAIMDMEGASMAHFMQMTPALVKKMTVLSQVIILLIYFAENVLLLLGKIW